MNRSEFGLPTNANDYRPLVSVVVPSYNHNEFLRERLESIYDQTYRGDIEVLLLDDASTDQSVETLEGFARRFPENTTLVVNPENSGTAFRQWRRGLSLARGDVVWIAESDDLCDRDFLETLVPFMSNPAVMLAFSQTTFFEGSIDNVVKTLNDHVSDLDPFELDVPWIRAASDLVAAGFIDKNLVPNASGAIFRHPRSMPLLDSEEWLKMRIAGDWLFYLELIEGGLVAFSPRTMNYHRYGGTTLTRLTTASTTLAIETARVRAAARRIYGTDGVIRSSGLSHRRHASESRG